MSKGRKILLTGATRGLGRALVDRFVERGNVVLGCGRSVEAVEGLREEHGPPHDFRVVDVADSAAVDAWAKDLLASGDPPDLVLNNAGVINRSAPLWKLDAAEVDRVLAVNVSGTVNVVRAFLPALIERAGGVVVNFSSGWGRTASPDVAPYCASKWAIEGLTQALAQELPPGVAAVAVNPGIIDTQMLRSCLGDGAASCPKPDDWSHGAATFLLELGPKDNGRTLNAT